MEQQGDIQCPGDIIPFNCSILSNSETIQLTWLITFPGMTPLDITYFNATSDNDDLTQGVFTTVTDFQRDEYIFSTLEYIVQPGIPVVEFNLSCSITSIGLDTIVYNINTSCELQVTFFG